MLTIQSPLRIESTECCYSIVQWLIKSLCLHYFRSSTQFRGILLADLGKNGR